MELMGLRRYLALLAASVLALGCAGVSGDDVGRPAPPFPTQDPKSWIGTPVSWPELRGRVVLLDVWTFGCINCTRTLPWVKQVRARYAPRGLSVVGVHTPEFEQERDAPSVRRAVQEHGLDYPQLLDNNSAYWEALHNEYWPTVYLVDRCGRIRARHIGEVHAGESSGQGLEAKLEALLDEKGCQS